MPKRFFIARSKRNASLRISASGGSALADEIAKRWQACLMVERITIRGWCRPRMVKCALLAEFLADGRGGMTHLVDRPQQLLFANSEMPT
jgi:hypothetical protein